MISHREKTAVSPFARPLTSDQVTHWGKTRNDPKLAAAQAELSNDRAHKIFALLNKHP